ncbi:MAG TPA: low-specificity L-threonine aldolase [Polyangia bacterium]|nr:low-specificity L-threonine aldolase [Polyangia bacterium]
MPAVDLRSDTVTKPSPAMREAMARADVGDDVYGEDPTVNRLQSRVAELLGKAAALFVPSGVMANQIALAVQTRPGDEVLISRGAHCMWYESGAGPALAGVQFRELGGDDGLYTARDLAAMINPDNSHYPVSALCAVENSHNRGGGRIFPQRSIDEIAEVARKHGLKLHLDGARLWNVHVATATPLAALCAPFDTISVCLSKGLGAPVGSLVAGDAETIARAHRRRKMLGGGMRQAGILAAAGLYALEHQLQRLAEDHANARGFAERIARSPGITVGPVDTNIVIWDLAPEVPLDAATFVKRARDRGLLLNAMGERRVRAVTHLDVSAAEVARGAELALEVLKSA